MACHESHRSPGSCCRRGVETLCRYGGVPEPLTPLSLKVILLHLSARRKITVIGGGYIGVEFAGIFKRFGAEVHVAYRQQQPLRGFDQEV